MFEKDTIHSNFTNFSVLFSLNCLIRVKYIRSQMIFYCCRSGECVYECERGVTRSVCAQNLKERDFALLFKNGTGLVYQLLTANSFYQAFTWRIEFSNSTHSYPNASILDLFSHRLHFKERCSLTMIQMGTYWSFNNVNWTLPWLTLRTSPYLICCVMLQCNAVLKLNLCYTVLLTQMIMQK